MGQPCGKCGSKATYINEVWSAAGRSHEFSCMMCGWRGAGMNRGKVIQMAKKHSKPLLRGTCSNCLRGGVGLVTSKYCASCYNYRDDPAALKAAAERLGGNHAGDCESAIIIDKDSPVVVSISFTSTDAGLYENLLLRASSQRRDPRAHILYLIQKDCAKEVAP